MNILLTGGTGFIGSHLVAHLAELGHHCVVLVRRDPTTYPFRTGVRYLVYDDLDSIREVDAVINLAGESVATRWTPAKKRRIFESRIGVTRRLVDWMESRDLRPAVFLSASAIGVYGDRPGEVLTEESAPDPQRQFRWEVCAAWEAEAMRAAALGVRTVTLRTGNVLDPRGGALGMLLPCLRWAPFLMPFAPKAITPWISLEETVRLIAFALEQPDLHGPLNVVGPEPAPWQTVVNALGRWMNKPVIGALPDGLVRLLFGEMAHALLDSQDVRPAKALAHGYRFESSEHEARRTGT